MLRDVSILVSLSDGVLCLHPHEAIHMGVGHNSRSVLTRMIRKRPSRNHFLTTTGTIDNMSYIEDELCELISNRIQSGKSAYAEPHGDEIATSLVELVQERARVGEKKYKTTMARVDLSEREWVQHALEEALDFLVYHLKLYKTNHQDWWWLLVGGSGIIPNMVNHVIKLQSILIEMDDN